jgi:hypothetical protein
MTPVHPETDLVPYLRGELSAADHTRVADHVRACAECARFLDDARDVLGELARGMPSPPEPDWGRFRAELRARLPARPASDARFGWWRRPVPLLAAAALASVLLVLAFEGSRLAMRDEPLAIEDTVLARRLDLLEQYPVVERLDLLEDLEVIGHLDRLTPTRDG